MKIEDVKRRIESIGQNISIENDKLFELIVEALTFIAGRTVVQELAIEEKANITFFRVVNMGNKKKLYIGTPREMLIRCENNEIPIDVSLEDALTYRVLSKVDPRMIAEYEKNMWTVISSHEARLNEMRGGNNVSRY